MTPSSSSNATPGVHLSEDQLLDLHHGLLSVEERDQALAHLKICSVCEQRFLALGAERERLQSRGQPQFLPTGEVVLRPQHAARTHWWSDLLASLREQRTAGLFALAATAAAVILIFVPSWFGGSEELRLDQLPPFVSNVHPRHGLADISGEDFVVGLEAYASADYTRAISLLKQAHVAEDHEIFRRIYLGNALAWSGKYSQAVASLKSLPFTVIPDPWGGMGALTLYIAYRELGETAQADSIRNILMKRPGSIGDRVRTHMFEN